MDSTIILHVFYIKSSFALVQVCKNIMGLSQPCYNISSFLASTQPGPQDNVEVQEALDFSEASFILMSMLPESHPMGR